MGKDKNSASAKKEAVKNFFSKNADVLDGGYTYYTDSKTGKLVIENSKGESVKPSQAQFDAINSKVFEGKLSLDHFYGNIKPTQKDNNFVSWKAKPSMTEFSKQDTSVDPRSPDKDPNYKAPEFTMPSKKKAKLAKDPEAEKKSKDFRFAMSKAKDISFDAAMVAGQYANNKQALKELEGVRIPDAPQKSYLNSSRISMDVDRGANKTALANTLASSNRNFSDANVAAAMRGSATSQFQGTASKINQEERNVNTQLQQATNIANSGIQGENNTSILNKANLEMQKRLEVIKGKQAANQQLLSGVQGVVAGEGARQKDRNQLAIDSSSLGSRYYNRLAGTMDGTTGYQMQRNMATDEELAAEDKLALDKATAEKPLYDSRTGAKLKNGGVVKKLSKGGKMSKLYC